MRARPVPLGELAHGTHVRGRGTYDPASIDLVALAAGDRVLVVERAGEVLRRLRGR